MSTSCYTKKKVLFLLTYTTILFYILLFITGHNINHNSSFYGNCLISIFLITLSLYTLFRTEKQIIINKFISLVVCLSYLIVLGSLNYAIAGIVWTTIFLIYPILIFDFFGSFTFPKKDNLFLNLIWALIIITLITSISLIIKFTNPFIGLNGYLSAFLFCGIFYLKNKNKQTLVQKKYNRLLIISFFISIIPTTISFLYNFVILDNLNTSLATNHLVSLIIFPFTTSFLIINQYQLLLKPNFKIYTILFISCSVYFLLFGLFLYYILALSLIKISIIYMFIILGFLLIYNLIDQFYKKEILYFVKNKQSIRKNKQDIRLQIIDINFFSDINNLMASYLLKTFNIHNFLCLWKTDTGSFIQLAGEKIDIQQLQSNEFLKKNSSVYLLGIKYDVFKISRNNVLIGIFCVDCSKKKLENEQKEKIDCFINPIFDLIHAYFALKINNNKNIELPTIKYPAYIAQNIDHHIEEINKSYSNYLHDDLLQSLLALNNFISLIKSTDEFKTLSLETINELIDNLRRKIFEIYPTNINNLSLNDNFELLKENITTKHPNFKIEFLYQTQLFFPDTLKLTLYRMVSELILNAIKHSKGNRIKLTFRQTKRKIILEAIDNGIGLNTSDLRNETDKQFHFGLLTIKEKVTQLNGSILFISTDSGLTVKITLPLSIKKGE